MAVKEEPPIKEPPKKEPPKAQEIITTFSEGMDWLKESSKKIIKPVSDALKILKKKSTPSLKKKKSL